jgi:hypothetical protein
MGTERTLPGLDDTRRREVKRMPAASWAALAAVGWVAVMVTAPATAQEGYAGEQGRQIKALSAEETAGYLAGDGLGLARAAELNQHPGPRHVLELAAELALNAGQRRVVEEAQERMHGRAVELGGRIVEAESALDAAFAEGGLDAAGLRGRVEEIARLQGELRIAHLAAHLETRAVLTADQVARYDALRGYGEGAHAPGHERPAGHGGHHGHGSGGG